MNAMLPLFATAAASDPASHKAANILAAARALIKHTTLTAPEIVRESLAIASGIDIYTNEFVTLEVLP